MKRVQFGSMHLFSTNVDKQETDERSRLQRFTEFATSRSGMIVIGGSVFALFIGQVSYSTMKYFMHLDFYTVAEIGFAAGFLTAASGVGFVSYFNRMRTLDVERVMSEAMDIVQRSPRVGQLMGLHGFSFGTVQTGTIRTYQIDGGRFDVSKVTGFPIWKPPMVQIMFQVWGGSNEKQAVVVAEAHRTFRGSVEFDFVCFDLLERKSGFQGENPSVIVVGDESKMKVRDDMRSFVTLNRVYVKGLE